MGVSRVTSVEVARLAGVSQSAVSRVFTPGGSASASTNRKVRAAAEKLGYRPNILARAMVSGKSRIIGLVVAHLENQFYPVALELLSKALQEQGYHILIFIAPNSEESVDKVLQELVDYQVDGIIAASVSLSSHLAGRVQQHGIPVVLFNRGQDDPEFIDVTSNNFEGGRIAAQYLIENGHTRIAHIAGWQGSKTGRDRQAGFLHEMEKAHLQPLAMLDGMYCRQVATQCILSILELDEKPDAVFVGNDFMAFGVIDALRAKGLIPGQDISVIGFDDVPLAAWGAYDLTTVRQPVNRMVEAAVNAIITRIESPQADVKSVEIDCELILRGSSRRQ